MFSRWPCHYLKVPLKVGYHKIIKLIFYRQPPCPKKCVEKCPKKYGVFSRNFLILLEQRFYRTLLNICVLNLVFIYLRQNKVFTQNLVSLVILNFYFDLVPPLYFLKLNRYFAAFVPVLTSLVYLLITPEGMY